ncbi:MAG: class I SAM-dependent methyltransferase [Bacteroidia bacterium]|nr:class I SAM-dependent methyltransferase [Bacteroidia bacterium]
MEVGCGEATTLSGVIKEIKSNNLQVLGFDISWSRINKGNEWLLENQVSAQLFVADLFEIPLKDNSIDVIYTSHSLEPNGGREREAITELLRVARQTVVLVEPIYELADDDAKKRIDNHGYVRELKITAEQLGAKVLEYKLLEHISNPLNPSGVIIIEKPLKTIAESSNTEIKWQCPLTGMKLEKLKDVYFANEVGIAYPIIQEIPILMASNAVVASNLIKR